MAESQRYLSAMETQAARTALDHVGTGRRLVAARLVTPHWYHPVLGLLLGGLVAAQALPVRWRPLALVPFALGVGMLVRAYQRRTGMFLNGWRAPGGRPWAGALGGLVGLAYLGAIGLHDGLGWTVAPPVLGALVVWPTVLLGRRFDEAVRRELTR